ncbi:MAG: sulfurtransferase TusA family protein [Candidatus Aminicenantes bacterium]|nr:sulfurtransferase TusA family protein [Candidatus Aminicenantes bacterium]
MATKTLDALGLKCPQPILKVASMAPQLQSGDILEIKADCESFPKDIRAWSERTGKTLLFCNTDADGKHSAQIQF